MTPGNDVYASVRHPTLEELSIAECYLCRQLLHDESTPDHVIPRSVFRASSPSRPQLPVHPLCNNGKSKDDEWFLRYLQLACSLHPEAEAEFARLLDKAQREKPDAFLVGRSQRLRNYKLATSLLSKQVWGLQLKHGSGIVQALNIGGDNAKRAAAYVKTMSRGLFVRNVPNTQPGVPELRGTQYAKASIDGTLETFVGTANKLMESSSGSGFGQYWPGRVFYFGSRVAEDSNKGFVFIEFYGQLGYLAAFQ